MSANKQYKTHLTPAFKRNFMGISITICGKYLERSKTVDEFKVEKVDCKSCLKKIKPEYLNRKQKQIIK